MLYHLRYADLHILLVPNGLSMIEMVKVIVVHNALDVGAGFGVLNFVLSNVLGGGKVKSNLFSNLLRVLVHLLLLTF